MVNPTDKKQKHTKYQRLDTRGYLEHNWNKLKKTNKQTKNQKKTKQKQNKTKKQKQGTPH